MKAWPNSESHPDVRALVEGAAEVERLTAGLAESASAFAAIGAPGTVEALQVITRQHRINAMLTRGHAAALTGHHLPNDGTSDSAEPDGDAP